MPRKNLFLISLLFLAALINLVGAFGPELGFDALWYHLTEPKLWLRWGRIDFIPGGLLYYSAMPRLGELLFMGAMRAGMADIGAHLINWAAGIGAAAVTYKIARKAGLSVFYSLLSVVIFYVTPLVGWQSGSAYVDLLRTFFESSALLLVFSGMPFLAGVAIGLAVSTKILALESLGVLGVIGFLGGWNKKQITHFLLPAILLSAPWFIWAYFKTGYPFYPLGAGIINEMQAFNLKIGFPGITGDLVTPVYLILSPFFFLVRKPKLLTVYVILTFLFWAATGHTGGNRFLLPFLPGWAVMAAIIIRETRWVREIRGIRRLLLGIVILTAGVNISYRAEANLKVLPYLAGRESKTEYLCKNLDFSTAVFVDCDGWMAKNIRPSDLVLVSGTHNLYYVDFPFVHESWYRGEWVNYILVQNGIITPTTQNIFQGRESKIVYKNPLTGVAVYKLM